MVICKSKKVNSSITNSTKLQSKWFKNLYINPDMPNLIEETVVKNFKLIGTVENFLNRTLVALNHRAVIAKWTS